MTFIARLLRYLFWVAVVTWTVSLLRRFVNQMGAGQQPANPDIDVPSDAVSQKLVRDPICGMHIAPSLALMANEGSENVYFCSAECRDKYLKGTGKFVANA
jgi:YHS domain-containing protein